MLHKQKTVRFPEDMWKVIEEHKTKTGKSDNAAILDIMKRGIVTLKENEIDQEKREVPAKIRTEPEPVLDSYALAPSYTESKDTESKDTESEKVTTDNKQASMELGFDFDLENDKQWTINNG